MNVVDKARASAASFIAVIACLTVAVSLAAAHVNADRPDGTIAYSSGEIWLVDADASGKSKRLTRTSDNYAPVVWSADGRWVAFERHYDGPQRDCCVEVRIVRADGRATVKLTPRGAEDADPDWSPTAPRIAFARRYGYGAIGVYVADADGSRVRRIMDNADSPAWSPDGRRIAYSSRGRTGIYVMNADGTGSRLVRRGAHSAVSWSPNGRMLLFSAVNARGSATQAWVVNVDGSGLRRVTKQCADVSYPAWSPDGRRIAFACIRTRPQTNVHDIYTANFNGTGLRQLTTNPRSDTHPAWSPDGQWIAYVGYAGEYDNGVWVMRSDGTKRQRLTSYTHDSAPSWRPGT